MRNLIKKNYFWLVLLTLVGGFLRFYKLGQVPSGFVNDEASFGYNAYSLLKTGKDEFGTILPLFFRSFGDYKLPVYFYLTIPSILLFGLSQFAVRFPSAFFGTLTIPLAYYLSKNLKKPKSTLWPILTSAVLAFLPWHIHFSRAAFEANLALFFISLATLWFLQSKYYLSFFIFLISTFTYHAPRLFVPLWIISLIIINFKKITPQLKKVILLFLIFIIFPTSLTTFNKKSLSRASGISIFHDVSGVQNKLDRKFRQTQNKSLFITRALHNKLESFTRDVIYRYFSHFDFSFLFFSGDPIRPRYRVPDVGQSLLLSLPFFLIGLFYLIKEKHLLTLSWLVLSPLPSSITFETPSSIRSLLMIIPLCLTISLGLKKSLKFINKQKPIIKSLTLIIFILAFIYNFAFYLNSYFIHAPVHEPYEWQGGYQQLVDKVNQLKPNYKQIIMTNKRSTPYIFFLFFTQYDPLAWQQQVNQQISDKDQFNFIGINKLDNIDFIGHICPVHPLKDDVLYICTANKHPTELLSKGVIKIIDTVYYQNKATAFVLMAKNKDKNLPLDYDPTKTN